MHAVVARSTFGSHNVQNTSCPDHFWTLKCRKSARRCGAKHIWKSQCTKHTMFGPLLEVEMSKKCTPLWREAHFEVKILITLLRVIPTMKCIHFVTGKSSGILSDTSSGILSGIFSGILSGISSGILSTQIFWHSIWQTFWHFIWHIFWHSI